MTNQWPRNESATGREVYPGSDSYRPDDVAREEQEREKLDRDKKKSRSGVDDLHRFPEDPNFGDYNIPPGGNHP
jgi:hypothetical protein